jgi:hypothetical protein
MDEVERCETNGSFDYRAISPYHRKEHMMPVDIMLGDGML